MGGLGFSKKIQLQEWNEAESSDTQPLLRREAAIAWSHMLFHRNLTNPL